MRLGTLLGPSKKSLCASDTRTHASKHRPRDRHTNAPLPSGVVGTVHISLKKRESTGKSSLKANVMGSLVSRGGFDGAIQMVIHGMGRRLKFRRNDETGGGTLPNALLANPAVPLN